LLAEDICDLSELKFQSLFTFSKGATGGRMQINKEGAGQTREVTLTGVLYATRTAYYQAALLQQQVLPAKKSTLFASLWSESCRWSVLHCNVRK
jgi:hypothetical protein